MKQNGKKLSLTLKITISLALGILAGLALLNHPDIAIGTIYLNLIKMIVVPVVLLSITQGIISLHQYGQYRHLSGCLRHFHRPDLRY